MIIVTGTKRSGTSMWMQILKAAGYDVLGEAFPGRWGQTIREANSEGFYESHFRRGIYFATNPHPKTGDYIHPTEAQRVVVKVFVPGLVRSDLAFITKVVATMRPVREYVSSVQRLYVMERDNKRALREAEGKGPSKQPEPEFIPPRLEWWFENYTLIRDALVRRYPLHMVSYESTLARPQPMISQVLDWLGGGDMGAAVESVREQLRTQRNTEIDSSTSELGADVDAVMDELYQRIHEAQPLDGPFIEWLNRTQDELEPLIQRAQAQARENRRMRRRVAD